MTTLSKLQTVLAEFTHVRRDRIEEESRLVHDLEIDSLGMSALAMALEDEWGEDIEDEDVAKWQTVGDIVDFIEGREG